MKIKPHLDLHFPAIFFLFFTSKFYSLTLIHSSLICKSILLPLLHQRVKDFQILNAVGSFSVLLSDFSVVDNFETLFFLGFLIILFYGSSHLPEVPCSACEFLFSSPLNIGIPPGLYTWPSISRIYIFFWAISIISATSTITYMHDSQISHLFTFFCKPQTLTILPMEDCPSSPKKLEVTGSKRRLLLLFSPNCFQF